MSTVRKQRTPFIKNNAYPIFKWLMVSFLSFTLIFILYAWYISSEIPSLKDLEETDSSLRTEIYSKNNHLIGSIFKQDRKNVPYDQLPKHLVDALVMTEDVRFYDHSGVDLMGWMRAIPNTAMYYVSGGNIGMRSGASTISMQVAGNLWTTRVRTIKRKVLEMMTAFKLERTYSKKEIIEIYFNTVFYGHNAYGIESAARRYFGKEVNQLDTLEAAALVGAVKGPSYMNPRRTKRSKERRNIVLSQMVKYGGLSQTAYDSLKVLETKVIPKVGSSNSVARYFNDRIEKELNKLGRELGFDPKTDGLRVFTTLDTGFQNAVDSVLLLNDSTLQSKSLTHPESIKLKQRYRRDTTYVSIEKADSAFFSNHVVQHGFIAIDHKNGEVLAHNGGKGGQYFYDHVFQGERQPGSTTKPFVYAAALEIGLTPADKLWDGPYSAFTGESDSSRYSPDNWDNKFLDKDVTLRYGISRSLNTIAVRVQDYLEGPKPVIAKMREMGIKVKIPAVQSLPLGPFEISPFEMVSAYTGFANNGVKVEAHTIREIQDKHGNSIYTASYVPEEVLNKNTAFIITDMLRSSVDYDYVVKRFPGMAAPTSGRIRFMSNVSKKIPVAAKTGTTNKYRDAWIIAYTPRFTAGLWVGIDLPEKDGKHRRFRHHVNLYSSSIVNIMGDFIKRVYDAHPEWEDEQFDIPDGVEQLSVCESNPKVRKSKCFVSSKV